MDTDGIDPDDWYETHRDEAAIAEDTIRDAIVEAAKAIRKAQDAGLECRGIYPDLRRCGLVASERLGGSVHDYLLASQIVALIRDAD